jgi:hypothetical protein
MSADVKGTGVGSQLDQELDRLRKDVDRLALVLVDLVGLLTKPYGGSLNEHKSAHYREVIDERFPQISDTHLPVYVNRAACAKWR